MKFFYKTIIFLLIFILSCKTVEQKKLEFVLNNFKKHSEKIEKIEYNTQRIDTFPNGDEVWNNKGYALIERKGNDSLLGISFYAIRSDIQKSYLYDNGNGFIISEKSNNFKLEKNAIGFLGKPGGQMISKHFFYLDSIYKSIELFENETRYILKYKFEDDTMYNSTDIIKIVELDKINFLPQRITRSSKELGSKSVFQITFTNIKINDEVESSISKFKKNLSNLTLIKPKKKGVSKIINKSAPKIKLPTLRDPKKNIQFYPSKLTLIDFWEVWCSPCIKSLPDVQKLKMKYSNELNVIGIVSDDKENAIKLLLQKKITFQNLVGNKKILEEYGVDSFPRYFLINTNGIIIKEYFGFDLEKIEEDIQNIIFEQNK